MKDTLTLILLLFMPLLGHGQSCRLFTTDRELSSSLINKIFQDRNGMIWIATEDGLNRYDGAKFTIYKHKAGDEHSLAHNYVRTLAEDSKGHLLIGTYNGIQMYNPATDNFTPPATWEDGKPFENTIIDILERKNGEIWVSGNVLCSLTIDEKEGRLTVGNLKLPIPTSMTDYIIEDRNQSIWMIRGDNGIYKLDTDNKVTHYLGSEKGVGIVSICYDSQGNIFAAAMGKGLLKYDKKTDSFIPIPYEGKTNLPVKTLCPSSQDELYIGTDGRGIKIFNNRTQRITDYAFESTYFNSSTSKVHSILKDNAGNFWLAIYQKGVMLIPAQANSFKYLGYRSIDKNIIGSNCITAMHKDRNGIMWVGTDNDGIYGIARGGTQKAHFRVTDEPSSVPSTVINLYEDSEQNLWCGSFINGMGKLDKATGHCTYRRDLLDEDGKHVQRVYDFAEDKYKRLWIATMGSGLFYLDLMNERMVYHEKINSQVNNWISCLYYSKDNKLYVGTYDGINCIDLNTDEFKMQKLLPKHIIISIYEDFQGTIWIGSSDGLFSWVPQTQKLSTYATANGLPSDAIYAIQGDGQGYLWISTNAGISQFHPESGRFINYYVGDGLQGNEFSKNASYKDREGIIWFGGMNGITYFNPQEITNPAKKWNIRITDFYLHNQSVRKGMKSGGYEIIDRPVFEAKEFQLSHSDNAFSIEFSTQELNSPERVTYLYAMNNDPWIALPAGTHRVSFSNLAPGIYRFRVKAMDYTLYSDVREIMIYIHPAWWATGWAKLLYFLIALAAVGGVIAQIRHRYRMRQEMMQHVHAEQLNEAKLQFFINISHEIRTPMSLIISPLQKLMDNDTDNLRQKAYRTIYRNAERILRLVNQLMDIRKIDKGQMSLVFREIEITGFINDLCETFAEQALKKKITLTFHHPEEEKLKLWVDPANFDKIILNILSNAFKFTPENGSVDIYLTTGEDKNMYGSLRHYAEITIADSGIGIPAEEKKHIFERFYQIRNDLNNSSVGTGIGLHLTHSLVELHHGDIHVEDNPEGTSGTRFIIRLPLGCEHLRPEEMDHNEKSNAIYTQAMPITLPMEETEDAKDAATRTRTKYRVLVVEDDEEIRHYISQELTNDYYMLESCNGKEALEMIFKRTPDLVISDIMMPEMDGLTLCRKLKQNVNLNYIPVILLTAKTREEDNIEGLETGADAYLTKPFNIEILRKTVGNLIRNRERLRNNFSGQQTQEDKLEKITAQSPDDKLIERVMKVINENLANPNLTVEMLCEQIGISRVHLHRKLKELTNQTTRNFIRNVRLKQAATLLSEKRYTVAETAALTGFTDPNNFSTAFKELYGVPPTTYMEEHLGEKTP